MTGAAALTDAERDDLLNGSKQGGETERDRVARVAGRIKAEARREGAAEVTARVEAVCADLYGADKITDSSLGTTTNRTARRQAVIRVRAALRGDA